MAKQQITNILHKIIGETFIADLAIDGISVEFFVPKSNKAIIVHEEGHDHPDAYFAKSADCNRLQALGKDVLLLWVDYEETSWTLDVEKKLTSFFI